METTKKDLRISSIGDTPMVQFSDRLFAKAEFYNPSGSIKDRMVNWIIQKAREEGRLKAGSLIVEATSGNTGISLAMLSHKYHFRLIVIMPTNMSKERKEMIRSFGATVKEVAPSDFLGAVTERDELVKKLGAFTTDQFNNPENVACHYHTTGKEILNQIGKNKVSAIVAGTGTGGTLMGIRQALIEKFPNLVTVAVEPYESAVMNGGQPFVHGIQGIGDGFIPPIVDMNIVDYAFVVSTPDAIQRSKSIHTDNGYFVGISSGANILAAENYIANYKPKGIVVTLLPDSGDRYYTMW